jgi:hypothetical protein
LLDPSVRWGDGAGNIARVLKSAGESLVQERLLQFVEGSELALKIAFKPPPGLKKIIERVCDRFLICQGRQIEAITLDLLPAHVRNANSGLKTE